MPINQHYSKDYDCYYILLVIALLRGILSNSIILNTRWVAYWAHLKVANEIKCCANGPQGLYYKTFYSHNLWIFVIS